MVVSTAELKSVRSQSYSYLKLVQGSQSLYQTRVARSFLLLDHSFLVIFWMANRTQQLREPFRRSRFWNPSSISLTNHPHVTEKVKPIVDAAVDLIQLYNCNLDKLLEEVAKSSRVRRVLIIQLVVNPIGIPTSCLKKTRLRKICHGSLWYECQTASGHN